METMSKLLTVVFSEIFVLLMFLTKSAELVKNALRRYFGCFLKGINTDNSEYVCPSLRRLKHNNSN